MKLPRRQVLRLAGAAALAQLACRVQAQNWPSRAVRLLIGFPDGDEMASAAHILANRLSEIWGHPVVVESELGAGTVALNAAARGIDRQKCGRCCIVVAVNCGSEDQSRIG